MWLFSVGKRNPRWMGLLSSPLMEDQWVNWESNLHERVGRCKKKKSKFNLLRFSLRGEGRGIWQVFFL